MAGNERELDQQSRSGGLIGRLVGMLALALLLKMGLVAASLVTGDSALALSDEATATAPTDPHPALEPVAVAARQIARPTNHSEARSLLESLARRQAEIERREQDLVVREERVEIYEEDLSEKVAYLEKLQADISRESRQLSDADSEAAASLAKVYAAMKPSEAAPLLDRLDDATVLRILGHMRAKQIGELLPLLDRDKAIVLTQALAAGK